MPAIGVNLVLVQRGAASVWFFERERGRYARKLLAAARRAKSRAAGSLASVPGDQTDPVQSS